MQRLDGEADLFVFDLVFEQLPQPRLLALAVTKDERVDALDGVAGEALVEEAEVGVEVRLRTGVEGERLVRPRVDEGAEEEPGVRGESGFERGAAEITDVRDRLAFGVF